jgi:hypothetical protein
MKIGMDKADQARDTSHDWTGADNKEGVAVRRVLLTLICFGVPLAVAPSAMAQKCVGYPEAPKYHKSLKIEGKANLRGCKGEKIKMELFYERPDGSHKEIGGYIWPSIRTDNHNIWGYFSCRRYQGGKSRFYLQLSIINRNAGWLPLAASDWARGVCRKT